MAVALERSDQPPFCDMLFAHVQCDHSNNKSVCYLVSTGTLVEDHFQSCFGVSSSCLAVADFGVACLVWVLSDDFGFGCSWKGSVSLSVVVTGMVDGFGTVCLVGMFG